MLFFIPIVFLMLVAFFFRSAIFALLSGIGVSLLLMSLYKGLNVASLFYESACYVIFSPGYFYALSFLFLLSWVINCAEKSRIINAYQFFLSKFINTRKSLEASMIFCASCLFIDDYLIALCSKSFFQPMLALYGMAKEKYAFIVAGIAAPLSALIPISSWTFVLSNQYIKAGLGAHVSDNFMEYINAIPYFFYPIFSIIAVLYVVITNKSYGMLQTAELVESKLHKIAHSLHNEKIISPAVYKANIYNMILFLMPFLAIFFSLFKAYYNLSREFPYYSAIKIIDMMNIIEILCKGVALGAALMAIGLVVFHGWFARNFFSTFKVTFFEMKNILMVLPLAWQFGWLLQQLYDQAFFTYYIDFYPAIMYVYPMAIMGISIFTAMAMGSTWGTIILLTPLVGFLQDPFYVKLAFGALISGALSGNHASLFGDSVLIASSSVGLQLQYFHDLFMQQIIPSIVASFATYGVLSILYSVYGIESLMVNMIVALVIWFVCMMGAQKFYGCKR